MTDKCVRQLSGAVVQHTVDLMTQMKKQVEEAGEVEQAEFDDEMRTWTFIDFLSSTIANFKFINPGNPQFYETVWTLGVYAALKGSVPMVQGGKSMEVNKFTIFIKKCEVLQQH